jgi:signal transduction histidine kinase
MRFFIAGVLLWLGMAGGVHAQPGPAEGVASPAVVGYCLDRDGLMALEQAMACNYGPYNGIAWGKTTHAARWLRIQPGHAAGRAAGSAIYVGPHFLPDLRFYRQVDGRWLEEIAGSQWPAKSVPSVVGGYKFIDPVVADGSQVYYLRIQSFALAHVRIDVESLAGSDSALIRQQIGLGMQLGLLGLMLLIAATSFGLGASMLMGRFTVYVANLLLCVLAGSGVLAQLWFAQSPWWDQAFFNAMLCLRLSAWVWLAQAFLLHHQPPRWYVYFGYGVHALVLGCLALVGLGDTAVFPPLIFSGLVGFSVVQIVVILRCRALHPFQRKALLWGFVGTNLLLALAVLSTIFPVGVHDFPTYMVRLNDLATPLVILAIISYTHKLKQHELGAARHALTQAQLRIELEQKAASEQRLLIDMITHEIKNPLASITLAMAYLSQHLPSPAESVQRRFRNVLHSVRSMDAILERCGLMSQLAQYQLAVKQDVFRLRELTTQVVSGLPDGKRVTIDLAEQLLICCDRQLLTLVLVNLLENALKYSVPETMVSLVAVPDKELGQGAVLIQINNAIDSRAAPDASKMFEKFYRNPATQEKSGSGLGLYLVRQICQLLGGIVVFRQLGEHVQFELRLGR